MSGCVPARRQERASPIVRDMMFRKVLELGSIGLLRGFLADTGVTKPLYNSRRG